MSLEELLANYGLQAPTSRGSSPSGCASGGRSTRGRRSLGTESPLNNVDQNQTLRKAAKRSVEPAVQTTPLNTGLVAVTVGELCQPSSPRRRRTESSTGTKPDDSTRQLDLVSVYIK
ncbi:unnamed protein product [Protopolystoma xenopodis]|uniref:Uncharacterized protein n=1 Tax=Protopolystoma xenopodis TaxID=117903 RepID=A0A3S5CR75_9PLAT|nr:unnamed protein product [Protopolystoma xenopodis]